MIDPGVALAQGEPRGADQRNRGAPPRVFHEFECRPELFGGDDTVAGVGDRADGPLRGDGRALVLHAHLLVVLEPAGSEDHAVACADQPGLGVVAGRRVADVDAQHAAVLDVQIGQRGVQQHRNPGLAQADTQRRDERAAHTDEVLAADLAPRRADADLEAAQYAARMTFELVEPHVVLLHDHHVHGDLAVRRFETFEVGAQLVGVERLRLDRPPRGLATRGLGVVVGVSGHPAQLQRRVLEDERQHFRPAVQIRVDLLGRDDVTDDRVQVFPRLVRSVLDAVALEDLVVRDPHTTT